MFRFVLIGAGQRGMIYARYAYQSGLANIVALAEPEKKRREAAARELFVAQERAYPSAEALFSAGKLGDAAIIASMDRDHYAQAMKALDLGYDLLLEKPISPDPRECMEIERKAAQKGRRVAVCHVLPYPYASANNWGLYNDMFGDVGASDTFRDYFISGCTDMPHATPDQVQQSKMPDFWQYGYSGGEFAEGNVRKWIDDEAIAETLRLIRESHSSLIGPCAPTDILEDQEDAHAFDANIDAIRWQMGYQLSLESLTRIDNATPGEELTLKLTWLNRGVAPFYYHWPLQWALVNEQGEAALTQAGQTDVRSLLPGQVGVTETLALPKDLPGGTYTLCLSFLDPDSGLPALPLNMAGGENLRYPLYAITIK